MSGATAFAGKPTSGDPLSSQAQAHRYEQYELGQRQAYAAPTQFPEYPLPADAPYWMNREAPNPIRYSAPSAQKERMMAREAIRRAQPARAGTVRTDPIAEDEVDYLQAQAEMAKLAKLDQYANMQVDRQGPNGFEQMQKLYPSLIQREIAQMKADFDFAMKKGLIDRYGPRNEEEFLFKYNVDQGHISGPELRHPGNDTPYAAGWLSPWNWQSRDRGLAMPGAYRNRTAADGPRPDWVLEDPARPLSWGTDYANIAGQMYNPRGGQHQAQAPENMAPDNIGVGFNTP